jgi:hypothetical protein
MQAYSDPTRASDPRALPDVEVFHIPNDYQPEPEPGEEPYEPGVYYWYCSPGCLPDSEPIGPFKSGEEALTDAREL